MDKYTAEDILFDLAFQHLKELEGTKDTNRITASIEFYNQDILEIINEANKEMPCEELASVLDEIRDLFDFHKILCLNTK